MALLAPVTLVDRTPTTPVSRVFNPQELLNGTARLVALGPNGTAVGQSVLQVNGRRKAGTGNRNLAELKLSIPKVVVETINGVAVPRVIDTNYVRIIFDVGPLFTTQDLEDLEGYAESLLKTNQTFIKSVLIGRQNVSG